MYILFVRFVRVWLDARNSNNRPVVGYGRELVTMLGTYHIYEYDTLVYVHEVFYEILSFASIYTYNSFRAPIPTYTLKCTHLCDRNCEKRETFFLLFFKVFYVYWLFVDVVVGSNSVEANLEMLSS